jgi:stigma-specific protein Stig1
MTHPWDEFSKSLAEEVPRRESLRRFGAVLAGIVLGPLAAGTARAGGKGKPVRNGPHAATDPCKTFCKCRNKAQQNACLAACKACGGDTRRLCGACGSYYCADLANDVSNCGACGHVCPPPGPYEYGACVNGRCVYQCVDGAVRCNGTCTFLGSDPDNCGACGNVCSGPNPSCYQGACGNCVPNCPDGWCGGDGCGGECGCPEGFECGETGWCVGGDEPCPGGGTFCNGICTNISFDPLNCGGCGIVCAAGEACFGGVCQLPF